VNRNEAALREVITAWGESGAATMDALRRRMADDCVWQQPGLPTTKGPDEAAQLLDWMDTAGFSGVEVDYRNVVATDSVVFSGRLDWLLRPVIVWLCSGCHRPALKPADDHHPR
jgi:limonene-1,2-epoxide hydrolase